MVGVRDDAQLREVLAATGPVLLDFDGPVCRLYTGDLNVRAAGRLRKLLRSGGAELPTRIEDTRDPLAVLRYASEVAKSRRVVEQLERTLTGIEVDAASGAPATDGADEFLLVCAHVGRPVVIVSNNANEAVELYLQLHNLEGLVHDVVGRPQARPHEMKPHPRSVETALVRVAKPPSGCVMVGDSITDIEVARRVGLRSIAYVKAPEREDRLAATHPDAMVDDMNALAMAVTGS